MALGSTPVGFTTVDSIPIDGESSTSADGLMIWRLPSWFSWKPRMGL